jgi:hypothetical protein
MSKNHEQQKQSELHFFTNFFKALEKDGASFQQTLSDPPDFILYNENNECIGIELTALYNSNNKKDVLSTFDEIIQIARYEFELHNSKDIGISFYFTDPIDCPKREIRNLSIQIVEWVKQHLSDYDKLAGHSKAFKNPIPNIPSLKEISFIKCDNCNKELWFRDSKLVFGGALDRNVLEDAVEKKHDAIERWHCSVKYDKRWLLLISTGEKSSVFSNYRIDEINWNRFNKFDKIFIFDDFMRRIVFCKERHENNTN